MPVVPATAEHIGRASALLRDRRLVAFPTETVYGLGADATNGRAVAAIFEAKGRPRFNPLIVHAADLDHAFALGMFAVVAKQLADAFWPGPLTLIVAKRAGSPIAELATAGLDTVALRVPSHQVARDLIRAAARPIAAPSANRSGHVSASTAAHVAADFGDSVDLILDGGPTEHGIESTVLDVTGSKPILLRPGAVTAEAIASIIGALPQTRASETDRPVSPGQLASHYAPRAAVRLDAKEVHAGEALLAFGDPVPSHEGLCINLSASGDLREAAANLFAALRDLDSASVARIAVMPIPITGLGAAIADRLQRAAAPRP